jgi:death-on-curing protein
MAFTKNHASVDGNKRIGLAALVDFLAFNDYRLTPAVDEQIEMVKKVAASEITEDEWTAWVERSVGAL